MWKGWPVRSDRSLFVFAIACSAFLVFLVQPMVGKRLLPWYGGAPGVWTLCLAFYQTTLFAGYAYAHGLMRLGREFPAGYGGACHDAALFICHHKGVADMCEQFVIGVVRVPAEVPQKKTLTSVIMT